MSIHIWPFSNFHELNADWILKAVDEVKTSVELLRGRFETLVLRVNNIDAATQNTVKYTEQEPTTEQQATARANINAASQTDLETLEGRVDQAESVVLLNGNNTITTVPHMLTVEGANEDDMSELGGGFLRLYNALMGASSAIVITPDAIREAVLRVGVYGLPGARVVISNVNDPVDGSDATNKDYVDGKMAPLIITWATTDPFTVNTPLNTIKEAILEGRQVWFNETYDVRLMLPLTAFWMENNNIARLYFGVYEANSTYVDYGVQTPGEWSIDII
jgi:hypothetical protein